MPIRKSLCALALASLLNASAFAGGVEVPLESPFSHGYFGVGLGPNFFFSKAALFTTLTDQPLDNDVDITHAASARLGQVGFIGNIHLGYGHSFSENKLYIGGELFGEWYSSSAYLNGVENIHLNNFDVPLFIMPESYKVKIRGAYGLVIHPGIQPNLNSLIYLILGVAGAKIKTYNTFQVLTPGIPLPFSAVVYNNKSRNRAGFRAGLGAAFALTRHLAFKLEYFYTGYGHINTYTAFHPPISNFSLTYILGARAKTSTHAVTFNLDFSF